VNSIANIPINPNITADVFYNCMNEILGPRLNKHFVNAKLFGFAWTEAAELEFNFLLNSGGGGGVTHHSTKYSKHYSTVLCGCLELRIHDHLRLMRSETCVKQHSRD